MKPGIAIALMMAAAEVGAIKQPQPIEILPFNSFDMPNPPASIRDGRKSKCRKHRREARGW